MRCSFCDPKRAETQRRGCLQGDHKDRHRSELKYGRRIGFGNEGGAVIMKDPNCATMS